MSWKKHFTEVPTNGHLSALGSTASSVPGPARMNYSSFLPDVYSGAPNRIERYLQFASMDQDSEVNAALDILAEFCTQLNKQNNTPFGISYTGRATNTETKVLMEYLQQWCKIQEFDVRIFRIARHLFMYGDSIYIRDPETLKWMWVDPGKVTRVIVNESLGKKPEQYIIRDLSINFQKLVVTQINPNTQNQQPGGAAYVTGGAGARGMTGAYPQISGSRFSLANNEHAISAEHIVHLSLSEGLDNFYPFGQSLLESVFKVYKQKELLEDAILIYRIQRAPERRIFYIDVGEMPSHLAMSFVERVKNEIHQRRIPSATGTGYGSGSSSVIDSSYNPMSINEDYYFPVSSSGRGSRVDTLPGGSNLDQIDDLRHFTNKMMRALRIPSSYLPTGPEDSQANYTDGRVGTAYIQELRFNKYCERLQRLMTPMFDREFKLFLKQKGINIDFSLFKLTFQPPQNFAAYRQAELDNQRISTFNQMAALPFISKRYALKRFLGLSEDEIAENERLWKEESGQGASISTDAASEMRSVGVTPAGMEADMGAFSEPEQTPAETGEQPPEAQPQAAMPGSPT